MKNRIKEIIKKCGKRQSDVADELGMSKVGFYQLSNKEMLKVETVEKIAKALDVPAWSLILTDEEIREIRDGVPPLTDTFRCPKCGASLRVVPTEEPSGTEKCDCD